MTHISQYQQDHITITIIFRVFFCLTGPSDITLQNTYMYHLDNATFYINMNNFYPINVFDLTPLYLFFL